MHLGGERGFDILTVYTRSFKFLELTLWGQLRLADNSRNFW